MKKPVIDVIIPAHNEERSIGLVLSAIPEGLVREVVVCNNASTDRTVQVAKAAGATVLNEPRMGYGSACQTAINYLKQKPADQQPDIVVFMDADYSDHPEEMHRLVQPIIDDKADLVIGSRVLGSLERGSMMPQQIFGNWLATNLIRFFYNYQFTDLGPFRAIRFPRLVQMNMEDPDFGWTVEMQVKAAKEKLKCTEVPVSYRRRVGTSKVSGTLRGSMMAGHKILWTIFKLL
ncbi:MAG: glycosyltransferase family 2 protein [Saprospiraceae bacterium]|nr:glycosyltransferase family 2 protein [Saprospiraceae bacterium]